MHDSRAAFHYFGANSGACVSYTDPKPEQIDVGDLALSLSRQCRGAGHDAMSIAQHCLIATFTMFDAFTSLAQKQKILSLFHTLLHDAAEAYTADIPMPLKTTLRDLWAKSMRESLGDTEPVFDPFKIIENRLDHAIWQRFDLEEPDTEIAPLIKQCDGQAIALEMRDVMSSARRQTFLDSGYLFQTPREDVVIKILSQTKAQKNFTAALNHLCDKREQIPTRESLENLKRRFRSLAGLKAQPLRV